MDAKEKINRIVEVFGMSPEVQAKAMKVSVMTVYNKNNPKVPDHSFNEKNYINLVLYIKDQISIIDKIQQ